MMPAGKKQLLIQGAVLFRNYAIGFAVNSLFFSQIRMPSGGIDRCFFLSGEHPII